MRVSVVGIGYVGLVTAAGIAHYGHDVVCIDTDDEKVDAVNRATTPICEIWPGDLLADCVLRSDKLKASAEYQTVIHTDLTMICVATPSNSDGSIDVSHIRRATTGVGDAVRRKASYHAVVTRSTVIPGTTRDLIIPLLENHSGRRAGPGLGVACNPDFLPEARR